MIELNSKQRKILEKAAQPLSSAVLIGGAGLTDEQVAQINSMLKIHELIKVKFNEYKEEKRELSLSISEKTDSTLVRIIGNVAVFYRPAEKPADRKFQKSLEKVL